MGDITVQYGDYTLPRTVNRYGLQRDGTKLRFACEFRVGGSSDSAFATACATAETKCSLAYKALTVNVGAVELIGLTHSPAESLLGRASIRKMGQRDSSRGRYYLFEWEAELPASAMHGTSDGFRQFAVDVTNELAGRRTVQFRGQHTAEGSTSAKSSYENASTGGRAKAEAWLAANLTLAQTYRGWERIFELPVFDDQNQICTWTLIYRERLIPEPAADGTGLTTLAAGNANVHVRACSVNRLADGYHGFSTTPEDRVKRLRRAVVNFSCAVESSVEYDDLAALYDTAIKPAIQAYWAATQGAGDLIVGDPILESENWAADLDGGGVTVQWVILQLGSPYLRYEESVRTRTDYGISYRFLADGSGSLVVQRRGSVKIAMQDIDVEHLHTDPVLPLLQPQFAPGRTGWLPLDADEGLSGRFTYTIGDATVRVWRRSAVRSYLWVEARNVVITPG